MTTTLVRVDAELTAETLSGFPHLCVRTQPAHATISGDIRDQEELQGLLHFLGSLGVAVVEVVTIPG
jgi:hypothetical protein